MNNIFTDKEKELIKDGLICIKYEQKAKEHYYDDSQWRIKIRNKINYIDDLIDKVMRL